MAQPPGIGATNPLTTTTAPSLPIEMWSAVIQSDAFQNRPIGDVVRDLARLASADWQIYNIVTGAAINSFMLNRLGLSLPEEDRQLNWLEYLSQQAARYLAAGQRQPLLWGESEVTQGHEFSIRPSCHRLIVSSGQVASWAEMWKAHVHIFRNHSAHSIEWDRRYHGILGFSVAQHEESIFVCISSSQSSKIIKIVGESPDEPLTITTDTNGAALRELVYSDIDSQGRIAVFREDDILQVWSLPRRELLASLDTTSPPVPHLQQFNQSCHPRLLWVGDKVYLGWGTENGTAFYQFDVSNQGTIKQGNHQLPTGNSSFNHADEARLVVHSTPNGRAFVVQPKTRRFIEGSLEMVSLYSGDNLETRKVLQLNRPPGSSRRFHSTLMNSFTPCYAIDGKSICVAFLEERYPANG